MKKFINDLWKCKKEIGFVWLFFFLLSICGKSPHSILYLLLVSCLFSIGVTSLGILYVKSGWYRKPKNDQ